MQLTTANLAFPRGPVPHEGYKAHLDMKGETVDVFLHQPEQEVWTVSHFNSGYKLISFHDSSLEHVVERAQHWLDDETRLLGKTEVLDIMNSYEEIN